VHSLDFVLEKRSTWLSEAKKWFFANRTLTIQIHKKKCFCEFDRTSILKLFHVRSWHSTRKSILKCSRWGNVKTNAKIKSSLLYSKRRFSLPNLRSQIDFISHFNICVALFFSLSSRKRPRVATDFFNIMIGFGEYLLLNLSHISCRFSIWCHKLHPSLDAFCHDLVTEIAPFSWRLRGTFCHDFGVGNCTLLNLVVRNRGGHS
jgi:hypothetical protein